MAKEKEPATNERGEKLVKIKLFKDNGRYSKDVFVGVAGRTWLIKRGVEVEVPEIVAEVLELSMKQDNATAELIKKETASAKDAKAVLG